MRNFVYFVLSVGTCLSFCASGECVVDGSVVGDAYSKLWNADVQRRIDERIERHRKADGFPPQNEGRSCPVLALQLRQSYAAKAAALPRGGLAGAGESAFCETEHGSNEL